MDDGLVLRDQVFTLTAGALCLDLANTLPDRPHCRHERLHGYPDLLGWARQAALLSAEVLDLLERLAALGNDRAAAAFDRLIELRECLYRIFSAQARQARPAATDLSLLNRALSASLPHLRLIERDGVFTWGWHGAGEDLESIAWPVVRSAARLLVSDELTLLRECAGDGCGWLFLDRSRSRRRRWCDMKTCGNRNKARRHYQRQRAAQGDSER